MTEISTLSGGQRLVRQLCQQGVERVFCVPGESYLAAIDGLYEARDKIQLISCRHESGAVLMAVAVGHLTGKAGTAFVTRGPGATNASIAVHIAHQASIPLVLCVGQVARDMLGREAFQEVDFEAYFAPITKQCRQISRTQDIAQALHDAYALAETGRKGPVVLVFPEDVLTEHAAPEGIAVPTKIPPDHNIDPGDEIEVHLAQAERPLLLVGGSFWSDDECQALVDFSTRHAIPVCTAFRRADIFDNNHPNFAGVLGLNTSPELWAHVAEADCLIVVGARLDEPTTRGYTVPSPRQGQTLIHIHPEAAQLGRHFDTDIQVCTDVSHAIRFLSALETAATASRTTWCETLRKTFLKDTTVRPRAEMLNIGAMMQHLNKVLPDDAIVTVDAGNFSKWPQTYLRYARPGRLIAPINGAMGYGIPASIAASLTFPERTVVACVGDGGAMMSSMEFATAMKYGAKPIVIVFNNERYGTIEMHQQRDYPERPLGNDLLNPDFVRYAEAFGAKGFRATDVQSFAEALTWAQRANVLSVIELRMTPGDLSAT